MHLPYSSMPPLPTTLQDGLLSALQTAFRYRAEDWLPLRLNGLALGFVNEVWRKHLIQDWPNLLHEDSDGLHLVADNWIEMSRQLEQLARRWHDAGLFGGWRNERFDVWSADGRQILFALERSAFRPLREEVEAAGRELLSDTDTEVVAHVLDIDFTERLRQDPAAASDSAKVAEILVASMRAVTARLEGTFALLAVTDLAPAAIVAARRSSPLVIGLGEGENFLGSDVAAFVAFTKKAAEVDDDQVLLLTADAVHVWDKDGNDVEPKTWGVTWDASAAVKGGYDTFMDKEIHEQPTAVADTLRGRVDERGELQLDEMRIDPAVLRSVDKIIVIACGTAAYAGHVAKYAIEHADALGIGHGHGPVHHFYRARMRTGW
ncbi:MAG: DUF4743 domain-containing protein [Neisseria elongata]